MSGPIILQREHFSIHQANEYFTPDGLCKETGQPVSQFRHVALKELLDNSLDAAETAGVAPVIAVEYAKTEGGLVLAVADNGAGIPAEVVGRILDFSTKTSDKAAYRAPTRGMQGNAIKTLFGMPVALGAERSHIRIDAAGIRHDIAVLLTPAGVRHDHQQTQTTTTGTRVSLIIPGIAVRYHWTPRHWIEAFGLFNPHARLQIREIEDFEHGPNDFERGKPAGAALAVSGRAELSAWLDKNGEPKAGLSLVVDELAALKGKPRPPQGTGSDAPSRPRGDSQPRPPRAQRQPVGAGAGFDDDLPDFM